MRNRKIAHDVLWHRLITTVNEQAMALIRSSFTALVRESGDLSAAIFDRFGRMMAQADTGTPGHINSMATGMAHALERFPASGLAPGDVLITNDPWKTASQLNDITIVTPVFRDNRIVAFFGNCCHALDIGGRGLGADSRSIFEEGLYIPVMKLRDRGVENTTLLELLSANVRTPREVLGDLHSQVVANEVGARQLLAFMDEFGLTDVDELSNEIIDRSEAATRVRIRQLPKGEYASETVIDGFDYPLVIKAKVVVDNDEILVDYGGTSGTVPEGINVALNYTRAYTTYGVKCAVCPDVPNNEGTFRAIKVTAPAGSLLNALFPSAVGGRHLVGHFLPSAVMGALAQVLPHSTLAQGSDAVWDTTVSGMREGRLFAYTIFSSGGMGASYDRDGLSATAFPSGIAGMSVEAIEAAAPLVIRRRELACDSGGAGTFRGGLGQTFEIEVRSESASILSCIYQRIQFPAKGLAGGQDGAPGEIATKGGSPLNPKSSNTLSPGTAFVFRMPGGGGFGDPRRRAPEKVESDLLNGYISPEASRDIYGRD